MMTEDMITDALNRVGLNSGNITTTETDTRIAVTVHDDELGPSTTAYRLDQATHTAAPDTFYGDGDGDVLDVVDAVLFVYLSGAGWTIGQ